MDRPKKDEYWTVQYGISKKTTIIVQVTQDEMECGSIVCDRLGEKTLVELSCFVDKW